MQRDRFAVELIFRKTDFSSVGKTPVSASVGAFPALFDPNDVWVRSGSCGFFLFRQRSLHFKFLPVIHESRNGQGMFLSNEKWLA